MVDNATDTDTYGHGTHVAGTIAGTKYGVAKRASIVAVKVFPDSSGSTSTSYIIQALEWVVGDAVMNGNINKSVINMSIGGGKSVAFNQTVQAVVKTGIVVVVAAANAEVGCLIHNFSASIQISPSTQPTIAKLQTGRRAELVSGLLT